MLSTEHPFHKNSNIPKLLCLQRPGFSKGWAYRFRKRHDIRCIRKQGEAASVKPSSVDGGRAKMREITDRYELPDIYNLDETSFFYHADAPRTLSRKKMVAGYKADKTQLTMVVATNADGSDKQSLLFIGKMAQPRASKKAWMNTHIFHDWLRELDMCMLLAGRRILLLVDNVSSHTRPSIPLFNVRLEFLPKNTTSVLQPLDQGIITCTKSKFMRIKVEDSVDKCIAGKPQVKISILMAVE
ncbi:hypothetical protein PHYSODRAFT_318663 [Phytophthora sojae]|uniref:HTH CENPB-type domain-containing protein n=1 Tax=Phytophthora sojae (strain P6497) TaxID=1094619 RepID=G5A5U9_PHYSP|nr:hypothetical protein PHYSODRAFT_318663 [Phytophthora sojae]EGZ08704.1 hypothetical protein PHYSODRAFT_318663 [Phytophthora sojae]|eukprot:XP_009535337.1 hypothetical protein PHYSODRAFT_318663 [Phytophthora sojae]